MHISFGLTGLALLSLLSVARAQTFAELAKPRPAIPGAPRYSDVTVRVLQPDLTSDAHNTLQVAADFHITRLEWSYGLTPDFVSQLHARGLTVGGAIEDDPGSASKLGRVIGKGGDPVTHAWFPKTRLVGCANAPEFRAAWLAEAKRSIAAGTDLMQQDDPQMAMRTDPPLCYCAYCQQAFAKWRETHSDDYGQFTRDSVLAFHREMHRALDLWAKRHVPFSHNSTIGFSGKLDFTAPAFDFVNAEIEGRNAQPSKFLTLVQAAGSTPLVFTHRSSSVAENRHFFALTYATGTWMMCPWDIYMPAKAPRYFGAARDYADLTAFVRANATLLDGYESAGSLEVSSGSGQMFALVRARPGESKAPVVVHLLERGESPQACTLKLRASSLGGHAILAELREPLAWASEAHTQAQATGEFGGLQKISRMTVRSDGDTVAIAIPPISVWGLLVLSPTE